MDRPAFTQNRGASLLYCTVVYLIAVPAAWYTFSASGLSPLWAMTAGLYVASIITFLAMLPVNNGSVFDAYWSILPHLPPGLESCPSSSGSIYGTNDQPTRL